MIRVKTTILAILYCLGLMLLSGLGTWQINRGLSKDNVLSLVNNKHKDYPQLSELPENSSSANYQQATLAGQWYDKQFFLLDNRIYKGQAGYEVLTPFQLPDNQHLLINRGWIPRSQTDNIPLPESAELTGTLYLPKKGYTIGEAIHSDQLIDNIWPKTSLYMDPAAFSAALKQPLSPLILVLDETHPDSLIRIWKPVVIEPERHYAYALQWYGLAVVFIIFGVIWYRHANSTRRTE